MRNVCMTMCLLMLPCHLFASHTSPDNIEGLTTAPGADSNSNSGSCNAQGSTFRLDGGTGAERVSGSGTLIEVPAGTSWSVPPGLYLATAEHVIKQPGGDDAFVDIAKANAQKQNLSSMHASIPGKFSGFDISTSSYYSSPGKGEAILIPVNAAQVAGITPMKIPTTLKASGSLQAYGYPGGGDQIEQATLKGGALESIFNVATPSGLKNEKQVSGEIKPGMSGGGVFDQNCSIVGVNTAVASVGSGKDTAMISKVGDVLKSGSLNGGGATDSKPKFASN